MRMQLLVILLLLALVLPLAVQSDFPPVPYQVMFRWRNDNGNESAATWMAAKAESVTLTHFNNIRLRFVVYGIGDDPPEFVPHEPHTFKLQYSQNGSAWSDINNSGGNHFQLALSDNFADGAGITAQLDAFVDGGRMTESSASFNWTVKSDEFEFEYCFRATQHVSNGLYYYRIYFSRGGSYSMLATATVDVPAVTFTDGSVFTPEVTREI